MHSFRDMQQKRCFLIQQVKMETPVINTHTSAVQCTEVCLSVIDEYSMCEVQDTVSAIS